MAAESPGQARHSYDVVVVGGGPAGAAAARAAARRGARVAVLERERVPRYKTCGGGLVGLSADLAGLPAAQLDRLTCERVDAVTWTAGGRWGRSRTVAGPAPIMRMVMRADFDAALLDSAAAAGAVVRTGVTVTAVAEDSSGVLLRLRDGDGNGGELRAGAVIGADGSASRIGAYVGVRCEQVDVGLEGEFPAPDDRFRGRMLLDWGSVPGSYGWLFPKGGTWTVGVIGARQHGAALRDSYRALLDQLGLSGVQPLRDSGHLTRCRAPGSPLRRGRVLVVGDAAGLLEPWSREGISYALRSGQLAGDCAGADRLEDYPRRVAEVLGSEMAAGRAVLTAFARRPLALHAVLVGMPGAFGLFQRLIDGRTTLARQVGRPGVVSVLSALAG